MVKIGKYVHECSLCGGTGTADLTGVYRETLERVERITKKSKAGFVVANRDADAFGCSPTALNNRLAKLEEHGYLFSEKYGRQRRFFLTTAKGGA